MLSIGRNSILLRRGSVVVWPRVQEIGALLTEQGILILLNVTELRTCVTGDDRNPNEEA